MDCFILFIVDFALLGAFAAQYAARLALEGDLDNAREVTSAHKNLVARGL